MNILNEAYTLVDDEGTEFEKNEAALKKYFQIFNDIYFNGELAPIKLVWFKGSSLHGYFRPRYDIKSHKCIPVQIGLNINASGTFAAFRNVFVHEMLHYYVDVNIGLPEENWIRAEVCLQNFSRNGYRIALRNTQETCHSYEWGRLAKKLSEDFPELGNIEKYAVSNAETGVALYDKKFVVDWCKKNVILRRVKPTGETRIYVVSVNSKDWAGLQKALETGNSSVSSYKGKWERLWPTLDQKEFKLLRTHRSFDWCVKLDYFNTECKNMIRKVVELGTVK